MEEPNPYAAPKGESLAELDLGGAPATDVRVAHLRREAAFRGVGLYYFSTSGALIFVIGLSLLVTFNDLENTREFPKDGRAAVAIVISLQLVTFLLAVLGLVVSVGLLGGKRWVRIPAIICATLSLIYFPCGTIVNGYLLYLLFSRDGQAVLSQQYEEITAATPELQSQLYAKSWAPWLLLATLFLFGSIMLVALLRR